MVYPDDRELYIHAQMLPYSTKYVSIFLNRILLLRTVTYQSYQIQYKSTNISIFSFTSRILLQLDVFSHICCLPMQSNDYLELISQSFL